MSAILSTRAMRALLLLALAIVSALASPTLVVAPDHVQVYEEVSVAWAGIPNPSDRDIIALFSPADSPATSQPLLTINVTIVSPIGGMQFALLNMRDTFQFRYLQPVPGTNFMNFTQIAASNVITTDPTQPMQGRTSRSTICADAHRRPPRAHRQHRRDESALYREISSLSLTLCLFA